MADCCIALLKKEKKEKEYRAYVTDMLNAILQSQYTQKVDIPRYIDLVEPKKETVPDRTAEEIIGDISSKLARLGK